MFSLFVGIQRHHPQCVTLGAMQRLHLLARQRELTGVGTMLDQTFAGYRTVLEQHDTEWQPDA